MMGLPTETDEDIIGIADLAKKVVDLYTQVNGKRGVKVTVSVSCFVPKPFTPFQWFAQIPIEEFERRQQLLKSHIHDRAIVFNYHNAKLSILEGVIARGDRRLAEVICTAWRNGAKFDGWSDLFKFDIWTAAFEACGVDPRYYNERERGFTEALPWDHTSPGVRKNFLIDEWYKAMEEQLTQDCRRTHCTGCGICQRLGVSVIDHVDQVGQRAEGRIGARSKEQGASGVADSVLDPCPLTLCKYRAQICKGKEIAVLSHLDYVDLYARALLRSKLPIAYSEGFNPHIKMSFATALAVGVTSDAEYMDFQLMQDLSAAEVLKRLNQQLPQGAEVVRLKKLHGKVMKLMAAADLSSYEVRLPYVGELTEAEAAIKSFNEAKELHYTRVTPKKIREIEIKQYIVKPLEAHLENSTLILNVDIRITPTGSIKPSEVVHILHENFNLQINENQAQIHRTKLTSKGKSLLDAD